MIAEPDDTARENQAQKQKTASGDLPVPFAENEIGVSFVPFATRFEIRVALHANALTVKIRNSQIKVRLAGFVGWAISLPLAGHERDRRSGGGGISAVCEWRCIENSSALGAVRIALDSRRR